MKIQQKLVALFAACAVLMSSAPFYATPASAATVSNVRAEYYFPRAGASAKSQLINIINGSKKSLDIAIYSITDQDISNAIIRAKKRKVTVRMISDKTESAGKYQKAVLASLKRVGIPIKVNTHSGLMHLKVTIADNAIATTGSFNYTKGAQTENDEVFVVLRNASVAKGFESEFASMWGNTKSYKNY